MPTVPMLLEVMDAYVILDIMELGLPVQVICTIGVKQHAHFTDNQSTFQILMSVRQIITHVMTPSVPCAPTMKGALLASADLDTVGVV